MSANSTLPPCSWHADFRNTATIPNLLLIKSLQFIGYAIALLCIIGALWTTSAIQDNIEESQLTAKIEKDLQTLIPKHDEIVKLSQTFWTTNNWISTIKLGHEPFLEVTPLLALLARQKPASVEFLEINLQFAPPVRATPNSTNSTQAVEPEKNLLTISAIAMLNNESNAINNVEEVKKMISTLPLPELAQWKNIQSTHLVRNTIEQADGSPKEILKFSIEAEIVFSNTL